MKLPAVHRCYRSRVLLGGILAACPGPAVASQNTLFFEVSNDISSQQPSAVITLWASFDNHWMAFGESKTSVVATADPGWFSDPTALVDPLELSRAGVVDQGGDAVSDIYIMQLYIPFSIYPDERNPIPLWSATWTTDDFSPRGIRLGTLSQSYRIYRDDGELLELFGTDFAEGSGVIQVVPAPGAGILLAGTIAMAPRCRRITPAVRFCR